MNLEIQRGKVAVPDVYLVQSLSPDYHSSSLLHCRALKASFTGNKELSGLSESGIPCILLTLALLTHYPISNDKSP